MGAASSLGNGAGERDFHTQAVITGRPMGEQGIDGDHVFLAKFLEKRKGVTSARARGGLRAQPRVDRQHHQSDDQRPRALAKSRRISPRSRFVKVWLVGRDA